MQEIAGLEAFAQAFQSLAPNAYRLPLTFVLLRPYAIRNCLSWCIHIHIMVGMLN